MAGSDDKSKQVSSIVVKRTINMGAVTVSGDVLKEAIDNELSKTATRFLCEVELLETVNDCFQPTSGAEKGAGENWRGGKSQGRLGKNGKY